MTFLQPLLLAGLPLSRMLGYVTRLRSQTKGLGRVSMRPDGFAPSEPVGDAG